MKTLLLLLFTFSSSLHAKHVVLVSYYDPFGNARFNNSQVVAKSLHSSFKKTEIEIKLCPLNTVFDKSYAQIENCLKALDTTPVLVLGLGEATCNLKVETAARNFDRTMGPDNEGNERKAVIIPQAPEYISMRYPLPQMYCALSEKDRAELDLSNNAGSFVCNNTAYQLGHFHPDLQFGFIHVPASHCKGIERKTEFAVKTLKTMITEAVNFLSTNFITAPNTPHPSNEIRLPILKEELKEMRSTYKKRDKCLYDFFKKTPAIQNRGLWSFLN